MSWTHSDTAANTGSGQTLATTLTAAIAAGQVIAAGMRAGATPSVSDTAGNTWTVANLSANTYIAYTMSARAAAGGTTITADAGAGHTTVGMIADAFVPSGTVTLGGTTGTNSSGTLGLNFNSAGCGDLGTVPAGALAWGVFLTNGGSNQAYTPGFQTGSSGTADVIGSQVTAAAATGLSVYVLNCANTDATLTWFGTGAGVNGSTVTAYFTTTAAPATPPPSPLLSQHSGRF